MALQDMKRCILSGSYQISAGIFCFFI